MSTEGYSNTRLFFQADFDILRGSEDIVKTNVATAIAHQLSHFSEICLNKVVLYINEFYHPSQQIVPVCSRDASDPLNDTDSQKDASRTRPSEKSLHNYSLIR